MYKDILIAVDLGQEASWRKALPFAVELARHYSANLHVITVIPDSGFHYVSQYFPAGYEKGMIEDANTALRAFVGKHGPSGIPVQHIVAHGSIYREIVDAADRTGADAVVMASHTPDLTDVVIGPNAERVLHHVKCSVFVIRE
jgi:nucleotide-binding universal stress UspA family protein